MSNDFCLLPLQMVFLFTDGHVAQEGFLELINNMLTSGMVPALFADDEKEALIGQVLPTCTLWFLFFGSPNPGQPISHAEDCACSLLTIGRSTAT